MKKLTWQEMETTMFKYNQDHNYTTKGTPTSIVGVAVIKQSSFDKPYTEEQRSYAFSSDNKAFIPGQCGYSIFSECLDGTDTGVRLDWFVKDGIWEVDYCYFLEEEVE